MKALLPFYKSPVLTVILLSFFASSPAKSADTMLAFEKVMPISVKDDCEDTVGQRMVFHVKEGIRSSQSMSLDLGENNYKMQVLFSSMPLEEKNSKASAYTMVVNAVPSASANPIYLAHSVGVCPSKEVEYCAEIIVAQLGSISDKVLTLKSK